MSVHFTPTISLILPTIGRDTIARALQSVAVQKMVLGDELIVVGDGPQPNARRAFDDFGIAGKYVETPFPFGSWGHGARNWVLTNRIASGDVICALDDDDTLASDHFEIVRAAALQYPGQALLFRMRCADGLVLWKEQSIEVRNVGTPMLVHPNDGRWGRYGSTHEGDLLFIRETIEALGGCPVWREEVIYQVGSG